MLVTRAQKLITNWDQPMCISHGDSRQDAEHVAELLRGLGVKDIQIGFIGPVIGAHSGPGTIALFFLGNGSEYPK